MGSQINYDIELNWFGSKIGLFARPRYIILSSHLKLPLVAQYVLAYQKL